MLLGAVGCIGAWFEKKFWLFIVNANRVFCFFFILLLFPFAVYYNNDHYFCGVAIWCRFCHCF